MREKINIPVREPSSITLQVIGPSLKVSPSLIGTKLMGTSGIGTTPAIVDYGFGGRGWKVARNCDLLEFEAKAK